MIAAATLAFFGYSLLTVGQAGQKIGLALRRRRRLRGWAVWAGSTLATSVSFFIVFGAISIGAVSLVGAMAGTGLVTLAIFGRLVMKERLQATHIAALIAIMGGAAAIALPGVRVDDGFSPLLLYGFLAVGTVGYLVAWGLSRGSHFVGVTLGGLSGFLGAYSQLFQKLGSAEISWADGAGPVVRAIVSNPVTAVWVGLSLASMVVIQFSYRHGEATRIIPVFTGNFIVVPVIGGVLVYGESLGLVQWVGVVVILAGSVVLGRKRASFEE